MDFIIGPWRLDSARETLEGEDGPAPVGTRGLALLRALAQAEGAVVSKAALLDAAWPGLAVEESNLTVQIAGLRRCLGDELIATVPRRGYRLTVAAVPVPVGVQTPEPAIAVLTGDDDPERYFASGVVREIIVALTRYPGLRVIAANSSRHFRSEADLDRAVAELGIDYALVVGVQRAEERVRVAARLINVASRAYVWADRYDRELTDIFSVQDDIAEHIAAVLVARVARAERERAKRKPLESLLAYDCYLRATDDSRIWHGDDFLAAQRMLEKALSLSPGFPPALAAFALHRMSSWVEPKGRPDWRGWEDRTPLEEAVEAARAALERDPFLPQAHLALAWALFWLHRREQSAAAALRLRELNPGFTDGRLGFMLAIDGRAEEGLALLRRVARVDPFHTPMLLGWMGAAQLLLDQPKAALDALRDCTARAPLWRLGHLWRAASSSRLGHGAEAKAEAAMVLRIDPGFTVGAWWRLHQFRDVTRAQQVAEDLIQAGVPAGDY
jgi:TolB-like protein